VDVDARVEALEAENQRLRDELQALKERAGFAGYLPPIELRLTGKEGQVLGCLLTGRPHTKHQIMDAMYQDGVDDEPELKIVDVFVCKLRKKLAPYGLAITTLWGRGYVMDAPALARYDELWGSRRKAEESLTRVAGL
jgi:two-component system, cell cycle response regulator CtrA